MSSYYEVLNVSPTASPVEVQAAIDTLYNKWRQAVTHPDPIVVEEANKNLRLLEEMRATLTDPAKRAGYDAGIGIGGAGGLADPTATATIVPPVPPRTGGAANRTSDSSPWQCSKCQTINPTDTSHCQQCGTKLADKCPKCGQIMPISARFCGKCGTDLAAARAERERLAGEQRELQLQHEISVLQAQISAEQEKIDLNNRLAGNWMSQQWLFSHNYGLEGEIMAKGGCSRWLFMAGGAIFLLGCCGLLVTIGSSDFGVLLVMIVGLAGTIALIGLQRRAKQKGAAKLNANHMQRISELNASIQQLRES